MSERLSSGEDARDAKRRRTDTGNALLLQPDVGGPIDDEATARQKLEAAGFRPDRLSEAKVLPDSDRFTTYPANPMIYFCCQGDLPMCRYLFVHGAAKDVSALPRDENGEEWWFPMYAAALGGCVEVCQWLFEHGAAKDVTRSNGTYSPLGGVLLRPNATNFENMCRWLILKGALSNATSGHIDVDVVRRDMAPWEHKDQGIGPKKVLSLVQNVVQTHSTFQTFLTGTLSPPEFSAQLLFRLLSTRLRSEYAARVLLKNTPNNSRRCIWNEIVRQKSPLHRFNGLPGIMEVVADFVGVKRGRDLRIVRELAEVLPGVISEATWYNSSDDNADSEDDAE